MLFGPYKRSVIWPKCTNLCTPTFYKDSTSRSSKKLKCWKLSRNTRFFPSRVPYIFPLTGQSPWFHAQETKWNLVQLGENPIREDYAWSMEFGTPLFGVCCKGCELRRWNIQSHNHGHAPWASHPDRDQTVDFCYDIYSIRWQHRTSFAFPLKRVTLADWF